MGCTAGHRSATDMAIEPLPSSSAFGHELPVGDSLSLQSFDILDGLRHDALMNANFLQRR